MFDFYFDGLHVFLNFNFQNVRFTAFRNYGNASVAFEISGFYLFRFFDSGFLSESLQQLISPILLSCIALSKTFPSLINSRSEFFTKPLTLSYLYVTAEIIQ